MSRTSRLVTGLATLALVSSVCGGTAQASPAVAAAASASGGAWQPLTEPGSGGRITSLDVDPADRDRVLVGGDMLGIGLSGDGGSSWQSTFGLSSYEIAEFTHHPSRPSEVWAGTMSGPHVSTDGGATWSPRRTGIAGTSANTYSAPVEQVLFDPRDSSRLLAFGGSQRLWPAARSGGWGAVWESRNGGSSWSQRGKVAGGGNVVGAAFAAGSSSVLLAAVHEDGVWRSEDGGTSWSRSSAGLPSGSVTDLTAHPTQPSVFWVSVNASGSGRSWRPGGVFKTVDGGRTWTSASKGLNAVAGDDDRSTSGYLQVVAAASDPDVLYTSDGSADKASVFRSTDGGASWEAVLTSGKRRSQAPGPYASGPTADAIAIDPRDARRVFIGQSEYMLRTTDGGATWTDVSTVPAPGGGYVGRGFSGLVATRTLFHPQAPGHLVVLGMDGGNFIQTRDGGRSWRRTMDPWDHWGGAYDASYGSSLGKLYVLLGQRGEFNGIATSSDEGTTWKVAAGGSSGLPSRGATFAARRPTAVQALDDDRAVATIDGKLYRTTNGGSTWQVVSSGLDLGDIAADPADPSRLVLAGAHGVYASSDAGTTLHLLPGSPDSADRLAVDAQHDVYATRWRKDGGVWRSSGGSWTRIFSDKHSYDVAVDPTDANRIAIATFDQAFHDVVAASGVHVSVDGGRTFAPRNAGLPVLRASTVAFDPFSPGRMVVGTGGRGFFTTSVGASGPGDRAVPSSTLSEPAPGGTVGSTTLRIAGTTRDDRGVAGVDVAVRDVARGTWLRPDGTWGGQTWLPATLDVPGAASTGWRLERTLLGGRYEATVRATDTAANVEPSGAAVPFTVAGHDVTPPTAGVAPLTAVSSPRSVLHGSASDDQGVAAVHVSVRRVDGTWLQGDGSWGGLQWLPATLAEAGATRTDWQLAPRLGTGSYVLSARATDTAGNVSAGPARARFQVRPGDTEAPAVAVTSPVAGSTVRSRTVRVAGTAEDASGTARVELAVRDVATGRWLQADGGWGVQRWLPSTLAGAGPASSWSQALSLPRGTYQVTVRGTDAAGNTSATSPLRRFSVRP